MITLADALAAGHGTERKFNCPVHHDEHPSASVNVVKGKWFCYVCHASGTVDGAVYDTIATERVSDTVHDILDEDARFYPESWLDQFDAGKPCEYWLSRFEPETVAHFRLGYDAVRDAATYPLRDPAGRLLGVVRRPLLESRTKYRYPYRVRTSHLLFNYAAEQVATVVLTEGATDAMAAWEAGYSTSWGMDAVALACFSNRLSTPQAALIERICPREVVFAFDDDEPGRAGVAQAAVLLESRYALRITRIGPRKDLAALSAPERIRVLEHSVAL